MGILSRLRPSSPRAWAYLIAGVAAALGAAIPVHPSGLAAVDHLLAGCMAAVVSLAARKARRWTWLVLAAITATFSAAFWASVMAIVALLIGAVVSWRRRRLPVAGSVIGALGALASLRLADGGRTGVSAALALVAVAPVLVSGYKNGGRAAQLLTRRVAAVGAAAVAAIALSYGAALNESRRAGALGAGELDEALAASRQGDFHAASEHLDQAMAAIGQASGEVGAWWAQPARALPLLGPNANAVAKVLGAAQGLSAALADVVIEAELESFGDQGRIDPETFQRLERPIDGWWPPSTRPRGRWHRSIPRGWPRPSPAGCATWVPPSIGPPTTPTSFGRLSAPFLISSASGVSAATSCCS